MNNLSDIQMMEIIHKNGEVSYARAMEIVVELRAAAAPQVVADERKPFAFVIVDKDRNPEFVTPDWNSAQEHINDACEMGIENAGKWKAIPAFEMRPTDDKLWDETMGDRDQYHEWADKLSEAIALHFGGDIGEHSNMNFPWAEALEIIEQAAPAQAQEPVNSVAINLDAQFRYVIAQRDAALDELRALQALAPVQPVAVPDGKVDWMMCERISNEDHVDEALRAFSEDSTQNNAAGLIQAALTVYLADTARAAPSAQGDAIRKVEVEDQGPLGVVTKTTYALANAKDAEAAAFYRHLRDEVIGDDPEAIGMKCAKKSGLDAACRAAIAAKAAS